MGFMNRIYFWITQWSPITAKTAEPDWQKMMYRRDGRHDMRPSLWIKSVQQ